MVSSIWINYTLHNIILNRTTLYTYAQIQERMEPRWYTSISISNNVWQVEIIQAIENIHYF